MASAYVSFAAAVAVVGRSNMNAQAKGWGGLLRRL